MMRNLFLAMSVAACLLAGCNDSNDNAAAAMPGTTEGTATPGNGGGSASSPGNTGASVDNVAGLAARLADADPGATDDDAALRAGITALFGAADGEPVAFEDTETLPQLIQRLGG